jgi:hypothetical protein
VASKYLFLITQPTISEIFLENWKADPTLNSSIAISVASGALEGSYRDPNFLNSPISRCTGGLVIIGISCACDILSFSQPYLRGV